MKTHTSSSSTRNRTVDTEPSEGAGGTDAVLAATNARTQTEKAEPIAGPAKFSTMSPSESPHDFHLMTPADTMRWLRYTSRSAFRAACRRHAIPHIRVNARVILFDRREVQARLERRSTATRSLRW